jgi:hypothetical protein
MALLNPPQILPSVAWVLFRALQAADGFALPRDELAKSVAPAALPRGKDAAPGPGTKGFDDTLTAGLMIGLFDRDDDTICLHRGLPDGVLDQRRRDQQFRPLVRDLILRDAVNHGLWDSSEGARDLTRALAWFLAQNPLRPPGPWNELDGADVAQERQFGTDEVVFSNDTRWGAFERWSKFLGFSSHLPRGSGSRLPQDKDKDVLVPDPTEVIRHAVPSVFTAQRQEIGIVIEELGQKIPVLDGGSYRREVEARMKPEAVRGTAEELSPSLTHALLRLRDERVIVLEDLADAPLKVRLPQGFGPERTITHASALGGNQRQGQ